jgi:AcrR family transcriptional regulator
VGVGARRVPVQERSIRRMERVLASVAETIEDKGIPAVTTTEIAERAGVSVGWMYQFFDDRTALLEELALSALRTLEAELVAIGFGAEGSDWRAAIDETFDCVLRFFRDIPGVRQLAVNGPESQRLHAAGVQVDRVLEAHIASTFPPLREGATPTPRSIIAHTVAGLVNQSVTSDDTDSLPDVGEYRKACVAYMELYFE